MCTSLKWTTWKAALPADDQAFGAVGRGLANWTEKGVTGGCWQRPRRELHSRVADFPNAPALRRSWATIGPCWLMIPSHTSESWILEECQSYGDVMFIGTSHLCSFTNSDQGVRKCRIPKKRKRYQDSQDSVACGAIYGFL
jgi:hypothetical protein